MILNEIQIDSILEIFNIAIGRAAASLSTTFDKEVELSVPKILLVTSNEALTYLPVHNEDVCAVSQHFNSDEVNLEVKLIFSEESSLNLAKFFLEKQMIFLEEVTQLEQDTILEIGNIFINSFIGTIANLSHVELEGSLPTISLLSSKEIFKNEDKVDKTLIEAFVQFSIKPMDVTGFLLLILDSDVIEKFLEKIYKSLLGQNAG
ncbi:MAG: hypothetical protein N3A69_01070 [Leptospiraceae bacterium]|nr:hypothetical protein [Leptospiraceae bacterium]